MKLEAGKRYKARNGDITEPLEYVEYAETYPYCAKGVGGTKRGWVTNGQWLSGDWDPQDYDLIEEYVEVPESVEVKKIKLEIGRRYVTRDGSIVGPLVDSGEGAPKGFPYKDEELVETWRQDGTWNLNPQKEHRLDIVAEYWGSGSVMTPTPENLYRTAMIEDMIVSCTECNQRGFSKKPDCDGCIAAVDDRIAAMQDTPTPTPDPETGLYEDLVGWALSEMAETEGTGTEFSEGYRFAIGRMLEDVLGLEVMQRTEYGVRGITDE